MSMPAKLTIGLASLSVFALTALSAPAQANVSYPTTNAISEAQLQLLSPGQLSDRLTPLRKIASAVDHVGRSLYRASYSTLQIDALNDRVTVYLADPSVGRQLITDARRLDPAVNVSQVRVLGAKYSLVLLHAARDEFLTRTRSQRLSYNIYSVAVATDGSGLEVKVDKPAVASASGPGAHGATTSGIYSSIAYGVTIQFSQGHPVTPTSWADVKWHDSSIFIGGDVITNGSHYCGVGLPAVRTRDGHPIIVTANHCFPINARIYTAAGATPAFGQYYQDLNGQLGNYVGTVTGTTDQWDAEELDGANNNADASESSTYAKVTGVHYSYNGDLVCQDGPASFFMGYATVCGISVINQDITFSVNGHSTRGVEGSRLPQHEPWAVAEGDSGSMVYAVTGSTRDARGIVSSGVGSYTSHSYNYLYWTEAPDIFATFGLKLNPAT